MEETEKEVEYTVLVFNDCEIEVKSNTEIKLSDGSYKNAEDININDDIDDDFLATLTNKNK